MTLCYVCQVQYSEHSHGDLLKCLRLSEKVVMKITKDLLAFKVVKTNWDYKNTIGIQN